MLPFQLYESHALSVDVDVEERRIVKFNVAIESQPAAFVVLNVYTPDAVYVLPFQLYELHALSVDVDVEERRMVKFKVAVESQPASFVVLNV
jgi:hypothetical protein